MKMWLFAIIARIQWRKMCFRVDVTTATFISYLTAIVLKMAKIRCDYFQN